MNDTVIDTHQPVLNDLPVRREQVQEKFEKLSRELPLAELQEMVDWVDVWLMGRPVK